MNSPQVTVVIPAYNYAVYLPETIQSVLAQTYQNFELIIVNDGSTDNTQEVVQQFADPRIKYLYQENRGATAARNTGMRAATGELIALLDADDLFHPEKLQNHVDFLARHPEVGVSYNACFELAYGAQSSKLINALHRPPPVLTLADLVVDFPIGPSEMVLRREWAFRVNLFDEQYRFFGDDLDFTCRLALAGCRFASVERALTYRRYHTNRRIKNLPAQAAIAMRPLHETFADPRCPTAVVALRSIALARHYMGWAVDAFAQEETAVGQALLKEALRHNPALRKGKPCGLLQYLITYSTLDENMDHAKRLQSFLAQLPAEVAWLQEEYAWAVAAGYLNRGVNAVMWGRLAEGRTHLAQAATGGALDERFLQALTQHLVNYQAEFGAEATQAMFHDLTHCLASVATPAKVRWLRGHYAINQAFNDYRNRHYAQVPSAVVRAIANQPSYLTNRGAMAILVRSTFHALARWGAGFFHSESRLATVRRSS